MLVATAALVLFVGFARALRGSSLATPLLLTAAFLALSIVMFKVWPGYVPVDDSLRRK